MSYYTIEIALSDTDYLALIEQSRKTKGGLTGYVKSLILSKLKTDPNRVEVEIEAEEEWPIYKNGETIY